MCKSRSPFDPAPSTTPMRRIPLCTAEVTRLWPDASIQPVFIPSAPG